MSDAATALTREFTVAVFVVRDAEVLLLFHRKLQKWLPPGGHLDGAELPDEAAVREVWEETGLRVRLIGDDPLPVEYPPQLVRPAGIQLETISPGHQHIDLIYYAEPEPPHQPIRRNLVECEECRWFTSDEMARREVPVDVREWAARAIVFAGRRR